MVSASLNVERCQVQTRLGDVLLLEQVVGDLSGHELVHELHGGRHQPPHHLVNHLGLIQHVRVEESVPGIKTIIKCGMPSKHVSLIHWLNV